MRSNIWRPGATMSSEQGHRILDSVRAGVNVPAVLISAALIATGDLDYRTVQP